MADSGATYVSDTPAITKAMTAASDSSTSFFCLCWWWRSGRCEACRNGRLWLSGLVAAVLIARSQPNARYLYPVLPFLRLQAQLHLARFGAIDSLLLRVCVGALLGIVALNLKFLPASNWYHRDFFLRPMFAERGRAEYVKESAPVRLAIDYVNKQGGNVMMTEESQIAGIRAKVYSNHWHNYPFHKKVQACFRASDFHQLASEYQIAHFIAPTSPDPAVVESARGMSEFLMLCGEPELHLEKYVVLRTRADCGRRIEELETTRQSEVLAPVSMMIWTDGCPIAAFGLRVGVSKAPLRSR